MSERAHDTHSAAKRVYKVEISDETFNWRHVHFECDKVTGAQVAEAMGAHPVDDFVVLQQLKSFELETLRPNELVDITELSRFFVIKSDGTHKFTVDGLSLEWPRKIVSGHTLTRLVGKDNDGIEMILVREGEPDKVIDDSDEWNLGKGGVEKFLSRPIRRNIVINTRNREWGAKRISFSDLVSISFPTPPQGQDIVYTITFFDGPRNAPEGSLNVGDSVNVKEGMVFSVKFTDKS